MKGRQLEANKDIREAMRNNNVKQYDIALKWGTCEHTIHRALRVELEDYRKEDFLKVIEEIGKEKQAEIKAHGGRVIKANRSIREALKRNKVSQWELGQRLGVSDMTIMRLMRFEMEESKKEYYIRLIEEIGFAKRQQASIV